MSAYEQRKLSGRRVPGAGGPDGCDRTDNDDDARTGQIQGHSGGICALRDTGFARRGTFGDMPNPTEPWWLRLHGASTMGFLIITTAIAPSRGSPLPLTSRLWLIPA